MENRIWVDEIKWLFLAKSGLKHKKLDYSHSNSYVLNPIGF